MNQLVIQCELSSEAGACTLCGGPALAWGGLRLARADGAGPVCRDCGRKSAPALAALLGLAEAAARVGRIGRHTMVPSMAALLELSRAAEDYAQAAPPCRRAG